MTFLLVATAAILGIFTGKYVYLFTNRRSVAIKSQKEI